ncbi:MAG: thrombospondin type 3 repeat-containing protein, partial [Flavobacteriales bacterium]
MKNKFTKPLFGAALACSGLAAQAQGLQGVIVEDYHTITQADVDRYNTLGNGSVPFDVGMKTYRVYIDMAPNYKLQTVFGSAGNMLDFSSTTKFWNDDGFGNQFPPQTSRLDDGAAFDSWLTIGRASRSGGTAGCTGNLEQLGVPLASDPNANLTMCTTAWSGFTSAAQADGHVPGTSADPTLVGIPNLTAFTDDNISTFSTTGSYTLLPPLDGPEAAGANRVLIAQITTGGTFSFHINVSMAITGGPVEFYTHSTSESGSVVSPYMSYPVVILDADGDGVVDGSDACPGTAAGAAVNAQGCSCAQVTVDDGNPCTLDQCTAGVVTHTLQDADSDGVCDANDTCPGTAAGAGVNTTGCSCAQVTVDDGNPCTLDVCTNGVVTHTLQDADADGVCDANDTCPGTAAGAGVNTTGCSCAQVTVDDANPCTLDQCTNGTVTHTFQDADSDGICDANDNCPNLSGVQGDPCDDFNANTSNDVITAACVCAGTQANDCNGVPGGPAQPGTPCDDLNACTTNDVYQTNCSCAGTIADTDADGVADCDDTCPGTAAGAGVNATGCSCAQVTVDDANPCTLDQCTNGTVTHTFQDADSDG